MRLIGEPLRLGEMLAQAATLGEALAREKGLSWESDIPADLPLDGPLDAPLAPPAGPADLPAPEIIEAANFAPAPEAPAPAPEAPAPAPEGPEMPV